jgi:hypothetical protein
VGVNRGNFQAWSKSNLELEFITVLKPFPRQLLQSNPITGDDESAKMSRFKKLLQQKFGPAKGSTTFDMVSSYTLRFIHKYTSILIYKSKNFN